jgi:membrane-bound lytic murein transglycosylase B
LSLAIALLGGCASKPPETKVPDPNLARATPRVVAPKPVFRDGVGGYSASYVSGDYAGYPALDRFIERMVAEHGFSRDYLNGLFSQAQRKHWTLEYMNREAPTIKPKPGAWSRYRAKFLTDQHISKGAAFWQRHADTLRRASQQYGVPAEYVMGIMGVETIYGSNVGKDRVLDALTTLAFDYPRRAEYFTEELENFLLMTRDERVDPVTPRGSFAGAMGLGQFMPGSFRRWAVDFDGDGRKDLWEPADAIGSIANYFAEHGWREGERVVSPAVAGGRESSLPESGFDTHYTLADLAQYGIRPEGAFRGDPSDVRLLRLSASDGDEYWLGHQNFYVITRYNHSTHYAMAVHELAQAVKSRYQTSWSASVDR